MDSIIQYLLDRCHLEVLLVRITNATEDSYLISIESRVRGTGPIPSTISPMELDLVFKGQNFGRLSLPEVRTSIWGTKVEMHDQEQKILDMAVFKAYVRSVIVDDETSFQLENGDCTIRSLGITAHCDYCLEIPVRGMMGPKVTLKALDRRGEDITATVEVHNPSPVEIENGISTFDFRNDDGETIAVLSGDLNIIRGDFDFTMEGKLKTGVKPSEHARLVGVGAEGNSWCNETIQYIDVAVDLKPEFLGVLQG